MKNKKLNHYYWDAAVYIALITNEKTRTKEELNDIEELANQNDKKQIIITTSTITSLEVFKDKTQKLNYVDVIKRIDELIYRPFNQIINVGPKIIELAREIRMHYDKVSIKISAADSIHLATAIIYEADEFHTFDGPLSKLNGKVAGYNLKICKPTPKQRVLNFKGNS